MSKTLVITNDFPPRKGGIQTFVSQLLGELDPSSVVVFTSNWAGAAQYDQTMHYSVIRIKSSVLLPTPWRIKQIKQVMQTYGCEQVLFGALAPLGLMSRSLKRQGIKNIVALTHGHEAGWAKIPLLRLLLKLSAKHVDVVTYLTQYTKDQIQPLLNPNSHLIQLTPAVDTNRYVPVTAELKEQLRVKYQLTGNLVVLGLSRLMPRKGFDLVIKSLPKLVSGFPNLKFVIAGGGPDKKRLLKLTKRLKMTDYVKFLGSVPYQDLPEIYNLADVFVMPCRTRLAGLDVEGFGIVYLEAAATALPVLAGNSGGAVEAVLPGKTGELVDHFNFTQQLRRLLSDVTLRNEYGAAGRSWVSKEFTLTSRGIKLQELLEIRSQ